MNLREPEEDEECRDCNLKLLCIFDYKSIQYYIEPKFKNCEKIHQMD